MSDLFHESVSFDFIDLVFVTMADCYWHTFQVLTKRAKRMLEYYVWKIAGNGFRFPQWPLKNVWIGVSCEDQDNAYERIPSLLQIPALVRFLSCEPLLGPIDLSTTKPNRSLQSQFDWVICGGESGHHARPVHPDWVRSLRNQCAAAEVPFFFKQWGEYLPFEPTSPPFWRNVATGKEYDGHGMDMVDPYTGDAGKFQGHRWYDPMDSIILCLESKSDQCDFLKVGKHNSGNMLDGKRHLEFPKV